MNRLLFLLLLISSSVIAQSNTKAELDAIFQDKTEVYFKFNVSSKMVVNELSKVVSYTVSESAYKCFSFLLSCFFLCFLSWLLNGFLTTFQRPSNIPSQDGLPKTF